MNNILLLGQISGLDKLVFIREISDVESEAFLA